MKLRPSGGRPQGLRSRVVAMSSTAAASVCSVSPVNFLSFQTRAFFLGSYLALPGGCGVGGKRREAEGLWVGWLEDGGSMWWLI